MTEYNDFIEYVRSQNNQCNAKPNPSAPSILIYQFCPQYDIAYDFDLPTPPLNPPGFEYGFWLYGFDEKGEQVTQQWLWNNTTQPTVRRALTFHIAYAIVGGVGQYMQGIFSNTLVKGLSGYPSEKWYRIPVIARQPYYLGGFHYGYHIYLFEKEVYDDPDPDPDPDEDPDPDPDPIPDPEPIRKTKKIPVLLQIFQNLILNTRPTKATACPPCPDVYLESPPCPPCPDVYVSCPPCPPCPDVTVECPHDLEKPVDPPLIKEPRCEPDCEELCERLAGPATATTQPNPWLNICKTECEEWLEEYNSFEGGDIDE